MSRGEATDTLLQLAAIGSRMASFNHDIASKIQGLMMSLDELGELSEARRDAELATAVETAQTALKELNGLLAQNRSMTKAPVKARIALRELMTRAANRCGVSVRGDLPDLDVEVAIAFATQALTLAIDVAAGVGRSRTIDVAATSATGALAVVRATTAPANAADMLTIAAWMIARDGGELRVEDGALAIRLPLPG